MFAEERQMLILYKIEKEGRVSVAELAKEFNVSEVTIRGDLKKLESQSTFQRTHGGAFLPKDDRRPTQWDFRASSFSTEKEKIGEEACKLINQGDKIFIDTGTTMECLARHLHSVGEATIITYDFRVAQTASMWPNIRVIFTGGYYRNDIPLWGPDSIRTILAHSMADKFFLSISGITHEEGLLESSSLAVENKQVMKKASKKTVLLVDSSKFGNKQGEKLGDINIVDTIITGKNAQDDYIEEFRSKGVEVILV